MTTLRRWAAATFAAAVVVVAAAGGGDTPSESEYQRNRERIEKMDPAEKRQLLEKQQRFRNLSPETQEQLKSLHRQLESQEDREELERVMEAYFEWVCTLSASERSELARMSPQERVEQVAKYLASPRRSRGPWMPDRRIGERTPLGISFFRDYVDALKTWAGRYVVDHADTLAELLPPDQAEKWKAGLEGIRPDDPDEKKARWIHLVRWYLAGPVKDMPLDPQDVADLEALMSPQVQKWFSTKPEKMDEIREGLGRMIAHNFFSSDQPEFENLIPAEELDSFGKTLPEEKKDNIRRFPPEIRANWIRMLYFASKLPPDARWLKDDRRPFGEGGKPPFGGPGRGGDRRGGGDFRERGDGPRGGLPDGMEPPPGARPIGPRPPGDQQEFRPPVSNPSQD